MLLTKHKAICNLLRKMLKMLNSACQSFKLNIQTKFNGALL